MFLSPVYTTFREICNSFCRAQLILVTVVPRFYIVAVAIHYKQTRQKPMVRRDRVVKGHTNVSPFMYWGVKVSYFTYILTPTCKHTYTEAHLIRFANVIPSFSPMCCDQAVVELGRPSCFPLHSRETYGDKHIHMPASLICASYRKTVNV